MLKRKVFNHLKILSPFHETLVVDDMTVLIESGIKLFLYQRGQIPLPFESLNDKNDQVDGEDSVSSVPCNEEEEDEAFSSGDEDLSPWERQRHAVS